MARSIRLAMPLFILVALIVGGRAAANHYGWELNSESLEDFQHWISSLGWMGPAAFLLLVVSRLFIGLSSHVVLILGGLAFGAVGGTFWGGVGLTLSGCVHYFLTRYLGSDWVSAQLGGRREYWERLIDKGGVPALFIINVHPLGPQSLMTLAAGAVRFNFGKFLATMMVGTPIRAGLYAVMGGTILTLSVGQILLLTLAIILFTVVPLFLPRTRRWLLRDS
jgi:uncharacterized membrane protein YdjX (TVP38/TMEM64 family)